MGWFEISAILAAVAFIVLVFFLVRTLLVTQKALEQVTEQVVHLKHRVDQLSEESVQLIHQTNLLTEDLHKKVKSFDSMFKAVEDVGESLRQVAGSVRQISASLAETFSRPIEQAEADQPGESVPLQVNQDKMGDILKWALYSYNVFMRLRSARSNHNRSEGGSKDG